jgi:hypothetical protein
MINLWKANKKHRLKKYHKSTCMGTCLSNTVDNPTPSTQKGHQLTSLSSKIQRSRNPKKLPTLYIANPHHFQRWKNLKMHNKVNFPKYNNGELGNRYPKRGEQSNIKFCYCLLNSTLSSLYPLVPSSFHIWNIQGSNKNGPRGCLYGLGTGIGFQIQNYNSLVFVTALSWYTLFLFPWFFPFLCEWTHNFNMVLRSNLHSKIIFLFHMWRPFASFLHNH